jgi:hypothetical protein
VIWLQVTKFLTLITGQDKNNIIVVLDLVQCLKKRRGELSGLSKKDKNRIQKTSLTISELAFEVGDRNFSVFWEAFKSREKNFSQGVEEKAIREKAKMR